MFSLRMFIKNYYVYHILLHLVTVISMQLYVLFHSFPASYMFNFIQSFLAICFISFIAV